MEFSQTTITEQKISELTYQNDNFSKKELHDAIKCIESYLNNILVEGLETHILPMPQNYDKKIIKMRECVETLNKHKYVYITYIPIKYEKKENEKNVCKPYYKTFQCTSLKINSLHDIQKMLNSSDINIDNFIVCPLANNFEFLDADKWVAERHCVRYLLPYKSTYSTWTCGGERKPGLDLTEFKFIDMIKLKKYITKVSKIVP